MAKQSGLGDGFLIDGYDLSGDFSSIKTSGGPTTQDVTGLPSSGNERIGLTRDGALEGVTFFNPDPATGAHVPLSALPFTDRIVTYQRGRALGAPAACLVAKELDYAPERAADGSITIKVSTQANGYGLAWGLQHTPGRRVDSAATNGASVDAGAPSVFGLVAFLHVLAFTGTSVTVKLQESSDNGGADAWADVVGGAFTAATAIGAQRIQTNLTQTVERYLRVVTTGTFSAADFLVTVVRHEVAVSY